MRSKAFFILIASLTTFLSCRKSHVENDICNCSESQSVYILGSDTLIIPNLFTPNSDTYNDVWTIKNIEKFQDHKVRVIRPGIGGTVYESTESVPAWNGIHNGHAVKSGKYKYEVTVNGKTITGFVCVYRGDKPKVENYDCIHSCVYFDKYDPLTY